jgi:hypothetical protein
LAAWSIVTLPKEKGGPGVLNLKLQNDALLLKHLHKFYAKEDIPWVTFIWSSYYTEKVPHGARETGSFWWKDLLRLNTLYRGVATYVLGDGSTVSFWEDLWSSHVLADSFPRLFSFATNSQVSVQEVMQAPDLDSLFSLPLSLEAFLELQQLQPYLGEISYNADSKDQWTFIWDNPIYTSSRFYRCIFSGYQAEQTFFWLYQTKCTPRLKFFTWLLIVDRLNTRAIMRRRHFHIQSGSTCVLCNDGIEEDRDHLFFDCRFSRNCWHKLHIQWFMSLGIRDRISSARAMSAQTFFMDTIIMAAWDIENV